MNHFFRDVPKLGHVAVSRHAQQRILDEDIPPETFEAVLFSGIDTPDGIDVIWREGRGIRIVVLTDPTPNRGAKLVKTVYKIESQAKAKK